MCKLFFAKKSLTKKNFTCAKRFKKYFFLAQKSGKQELDPEEILCYIYMCVKANPT